MDTIAKIKDIFYTLDKREAEGLVYDRYFMDILNITEEIFMLLYSERKDISEETNFYRKKIVDLYRTENLKYELYIYLNKVCFLLEQPALYGDDHIAILYGGAAKAVTDFLFAFFQYSSTYVLKYKNKKVHSFVEKEGHVEIKYEKGQLMPTEIVESLYGSIMNGEYLNEKQNKAIVTVNQSINRIYANFLSKFTNEEFYEEYKGFVVFEKQYTLPIINTEKEVPIGKLISMPENRRYIFPSSGVRFEFLNKRTNIDYIDIVESKNIVSVNVYVINNGGINIIKNYVNTDNTPEDNINYSNRDINSRERITSKVIKFPFYIKKDELKRATDEDSLYKSINVLGYMPASSGATEDFFYDLFKLILNCLYSSYYDLNIFKSIIKMSNKSKGYSGGEHKSNTFRIAHIRRLPEGQKASKETLLNAKKQGFENIPEGYTFVRAHIENEPHKKIVKVR